MTVMWSRIRDHTPIMWSSCDQVTCSLSTVSGRHPSEPVRYSPASPSRRGTGLERVKWAKSWRGFFLAASWERVKILKLSVLELIWFMGALFYNNIMWDVNFAETPTNSPNCLATNPCEIHIAVIRNFTLCTMTLTFLCDWYAPLVVTAKRGWFWVRESEVT